MFLNFNLYLKNPTILFMKILSAFYYSVQD